MNNCCCLLLSAIEHTILYSPCQRKVIAYIDIALCYVNSTVLIAYYMVCVESRAEDIPASWAPAASTRVLVHLLESSVFYLKRCLSESSTPLVAFKVLSRVLTRSLNKTSTVQDQSRHPLEQNDHTNNKSKLWSVNQMYIYLLVCWLNWIYHCHSLV